MVVVGVADGLFLAADADITERRGGCDGRGDKAVIAKLPSKIQGPASCGLDADVRRLYVEECRVEGLQLGGGHEPSVGLAELAARAGVVAGRAAHGGLVS